MRKVLLRLFSHRFLAIGRWEIHFLYLRIWNALTFKHGRVRAFLESRARPCYLNLGAGPRGLDDEHWVNIDGFRDRNIHFFVDLNRALPFPDGAFDGVFCEHVLEHFTQEDGERLAGEIRRVLRLGGVLRVIVPDAEHVVRCYLECPDDLLAYRSNRLAGETPMEMVNSFFRQRYEHQFLYDWPTLKKSLTRAGFRNIQRASVGQSHLCQGIVLDDLKYAWESLYVEAEKA